MPRITTTNAGAYGLSSNVLNLKNNLLQPVTNLTANTFVLDEGQTTEIKFIYRNYVHPSTIYWELVPGSNFNSSDISTSLNGNFQTKSKNNEENIYVTTIEDLTYIDEEITETFRIRFRENDSTGNIIILSTEFSVLDTSNTEFIGQVAFTSPITTTWQVPPFVSSISMVAIGSGGSGDSTPGRTPGVPGITFEYGGAAGGGGGGLAWKNNVPVTAGETLTVVVGGGESYVSRGPTKFLRALGGSSASRTTGGAGGPFVGDGGGTGGNGLSVPSTPSPFGPFGLSGGGGGGAGGYSGSGAPGNTAIAPAGGGASGGNPSSSPVAGGGGGGGVGILGIGSPGTSLRNGGSGGTNGSLGGSPSTSFRAGGAGGSFGGGGGGGNAYAPTRNQNSGPGGPGQPGAVRIIYPGQTRQFPTTRTGNE